MRTNEEYWEKFLDIQLETTSFDNVMEMFDISPHEAFEVLISSGLVDEELLEDLAGIREFNAHGE